VDPELIAGFPDEFGGFLRDVNRPPRRANPNYPDAPPSWAERIRRWQRTRRNVTPATYMDVLRDELTRAGKPLIEPRVLGEHSKVVFRHARYLSRPRANSTFSC
jgi:hypothetical protein